MLPVTKEYADENTLVCNTGKERSNHGTCRVDDDGHPHVFFRQGAGQVRYYRWLGSAWQGPVVVTRDSRGQDGDMIVESPKVVRMLLSHSHSGVGEVRWWKTTDGGLSWGKESCLLSSPSSSYNISALVRNSHPDGRIVVNENNRSQNHLYRKLFLLGDGGPVGRPEEEAGHLGDRLKNLGAAKTAPKSRKGAKKHRKTSGEENDGDQ